MTDDFFKAISLQAQAWSLLESCELVAAHLLDRDPGMATRLSAKFREAARLLAAAADKIDPQPDLQEDELKKLFR